MRTPNEYLTDYLKYKGISIYSPTIDKSIILEVMEGYAPKKFSEHNIDSFNEFDLIYTLNKDMSIDDKLSVIRKICDRYDIINYEIDKLCLRNIKINNIFETDDDTKLIVNVNGSVHISNKYLTKFPMDFGKVTGYFDCCENKLTTLIGSPKYVGGFFNCSRNNITTLEGGPKIVNGAFICVRNQLTDFYGFPDRVKDVDMNGNNVNEILNLSPYKTNYLPNFIKYINEFSVIQEGKYIIKEKLQRAYHLHTKEEISLNQQVFTKYKLI